MIYRKGQVAIFIIVGIVLLVAILSLFIVRRKPTVSRGQNFDNPESIIDTCIREKAKETLNMLFAHGGFLVNNNSVLYKGEKINYICNNINYYQPCIVQYPRYVQAVENTFEQQLKSHVADCFMQTEQILSQKGYQVKGGIININATFKPGVVSIRTNRDFTVLKEGFSKRFTNFDTAIDTPAYELTSTANEIMAQEAKNCYFSNDGFMVLYPNYDIRVDKLGDATKIYTIMDKPSRAKLTIALRGCAIPAGF